jgi:hypothetical protein
VASLETVGTSRLMVEVLIVRSLLEACALGKDSGIEMLNDLKA